jgi:glycosyltransferase involved in cell wall biosynthesis
MKGIYFSRIMPGIESGGGARRRAYQVREALQTLCPFEWVSAPRGDRIDGRTLEKIKAAGRTLKGRHFITHPGLKWWAPERRNNIYYLGRISRQWTKTIRELPRLDLAVVDDPIYFPYLVKKLKKIGIPVIACCHNIETLSAGQVALTRVKKLLHRELEILRLCDLAVTISREETWLLRSFNINAFFFPYFPPHQVYQRLLSIRRARSQGPGEKENIIFLGSVGNLATRQGLLKVIEYWRGENVSSRFGRLWAAGYRTDTFLKHLRSDPHIEFLGALSDGELDKRLARVKACLCYQEGGGGALTRIGEMLTAGVPVLANSDAARSYYHMKGLIEFPTLNHLPRAIAQTGQIEGDIPEPAAPDPSLLVSEVERILKNSG